MKPDPEALSRHYQALSDAALLEIDRDELVEAAQQQYDAELNRRGLDPELPAGRRAAEAGPSHFRGDGAARYGGENELRPAWLEDSAEVYSAVVTPRGKSAEDMVAEASQALEEAEIPHYSELVELTPEEAAHYSARHRWRIAAPRVLSLWAVNVIERQIANPEFEAAWRAHLEAFSDEELAQMPPRVVFCDLYDRVERAEQAYAEEMARRGLNEEE
jgi:hypothetical protein